MMIEVEKKNQPFSPFSANSLFFAAPFSFFSASFTVFSPFVSPSTALSETPPLEVDGCEVFSSRARLTENNKCYIVELHNLITFIFLFCIWYNNKTTKPLKRSFLSSVYASDNNKYRDQFQWPLFIHYHETYENLTQFLHSCQYQHQKLTLKSQISILKITILQTSLQNVSLRNTN